MLLKALVAAAPYFVAMERDLKERTIAWCLAARAGGAAARETALVVRGPPAPPPRRMTCAMMGPPNLPDVEAAISARVLDGELVTVSCDSASKAKALQVSLERRFGEGTVFLLVGADTAAKKQRFTRLEAEFAEHGFLVAIWTHCICQGPSVDPEAPFTALHMVLVFHRNLMSPEDATQIGWRVRKTSRMLILFWVPDDEDVPAHVDLRVESIHQRALAQRDTLVAQVRETTSRALQGRIDHIFASAPGDLTYRVVVPPPGSRTRLPHGVIVRAGNALTRMAAEMVAEEWQAFYSYTSLVAFIVTSWGHLAVGPIGPARADGAPAGAVTGVDADARQRIEAAAADTTERAKEDACRAIAEAADVTEDEFERLRVTTNKTPEERAVVAKRWVRTLSGKHYDETDPGAVETVTVEDVQRLHGPNGQVRAQLYAFFGTMDGADETWFVEAERSGAVAMKGPDRRKALRDAARVLGVELGLPMDEAAAGWEEEDPADHDAEIAAEAEGHELVPTYSYRGDEELPRPQVARLWAVYRSLDDAKGGHITAMADPQKRSTWVKLYKVVLARLYPAGLFVRQATRKVPGTRGKVALHICSWPLLSYYVTAWWRWRTFEKGVLGPPHDDAHALAWAQYEYAWVDDEAVEIPE